MNLVNSTLYNNSFPKVLKNAKILPRYKNFSDITNPIYLIPISIISPLSKIIEKVWNQQIMKHLINNKLVSHSFQGALKGRSTTIAVLNLYKKLVNLKSKKYDMAVISMDQSAILWIIKYYEKNLYI